MTGAPEWPELTADGQPVGWRVIDPDGNVVDSGPGIVLEAVSAAGEQTDGQETE